MEYSITCIPRQLYAECLSVHTASVDCRTNSQRITLVGVYASFAEAYTGAISVFNAANWLDVGIRDDVVDAQGDVIKIVMISLRLCGAGASQLEFESDSKRQAVLLLLVNSAPCRAQRLFNSKVTAVRWYPTRRTHTCKYKT